MRNKLSSLATLLLPTAALAANGWTLDRASGAAVMDEISTLTFTVGNSAASTDRLDRVQFQLNQQAYDIEGGVAPPGWVVQTIDKKDKKVTFVASGSCPKGLAAGATASFGLRVVGVAAGGDVTNQSFLFGNGKTEAESTCNSGSFPDPTGSYSWTRAGLGAGLSTNPRTVGPGGTLTVTLTVTNRSTNTQSNISAPVPQPSLAVFTRVGTLPPNLTLAPGETGTFNWTFTADSDGVATFAASAANTGANSVSSAQVQSLTVSVGSFTGAMSLSPTGAIAGDQLAVSLTVSNNDSVTLTNVQPNAPAVSGTASVTLLSGPSPASQASLSAGSSVRFDWTYRIEASSAVGSTFQFDGQSTALKGGLPTSSVPVASALGYVVTHTIASNPVSVMSGSGTRTIAYTVRNGGSQNITQVGILATGSPFNSPSNSGDTSGWTVGSANNPTRYTFTAPSAASELLPGQSKTFTMSYGIGTVSQTTSYSHRAILTQKDNTTARVETAVTVFINRTVPEIIDLVALSGPQRNRLIWTNPSDHDGVLVLRSTSGAPDTAPTSGTQYGAGATLGNATVAYVDGASFSSSFSDNNLTDGLRYYYKVYNHDPYWIYSSGNVPSSLGIFSEPASRALRSPLWCYNTGWSSNVQPVAEAGVGVFSAGNFKAVTSNLTSTNPDLDGSERWRPVRVTGAVQSRSPVVPLAGRSGKYILVGDQTAKGYVISAQTGAVVWSAGPFVSSGGIQAAPAVQLNQYANAGFQSAWPGVDLIFFATRRSSNPTQNEVRARKSSDGSEAWSYAPGNLDIISGGMFVDYTNNRLWVASRSNGGTQASLRVLSTLNGSLVTSFNLGDIDHAINLEAFSKVVLVTTNAGTVYAYDPSTITQVWTHSLGGSTTTAVAPITNGFIASMAGGTVQRYAVDPTTKAVSSVWASPPSFTAPSGARVEYTSQKIYAGDQSGVLHQLNALTGADENPLRVSNGAALATPAIDLSTTPKRLTINSEDGRLCAFDVPF